MIYDEPKQLFKVTKMLDEYEVDCKPLQVAMLDLDTNEINDNFNPYITGQDNLTSIFLHFIEMESELEVYKELVTIQGQKIILSYSAECKVNSAYLISKDNTCLPIDMENIPKELKQINNFDELNAYLFNTYSTVVKLSDDTFKFYVHHKLLGGVKDEAEGSMTPRTQGRRSHLEQKETDEAFESEKAALLAYRNTFTEAGQSFLQKKHLTETEEALKGFEEGVLFYQLYQQNIRHKAEKDFSSPADDKPLVVRFGMNTGALISSVGAAIKDNLHPIESHLFELAKQCLLKMPSAETYLQGESEKQSKGKSSAKEEKGQHYTYPNNVVLVDIFVRDNGKIKKEENSNKPETHTIALWHRAPNEILVIDPSKVDFSKDWSNTIIKQFKGVTIKGHAPTSGILYGTGGKDTGYNELKSTPISEHKYRDCVDIAAKIGFELNELQMDDNISTLAQIERGMNLQISNQKAVATYLTNASSGQPNRGSQSTDAKIRHENRQILELLK